MAVAQEFEIRDPIHGAVAVGVDERLVVDHPFVQRLRGIRQLGFSDLPFPGATHSRYAHSVGAFHLAGKAFDAAVRGSPLHGHPRARELRTCLRLAALCHDLGHAPFSHAAEFAMPTVGELRGGPPGGRQATHEDYTVAILCSSSLAQTINGNFPFQPEHVASLVAPELPPPDDFFRVGGLDFRPLLAQLISSELDVDRMDYLVRDSTFTGARYGAIDTDWLISHLAGHPGPDGRVGLALDRRAILAFDDFLIARLHMFLMVYFHQKSIAYEQLLERYMRGPDCDYRLPADLDEYLVCDDAHLLGHLRRSENEWARRIVQRRPFKLLVEAHGQPESVDLRPLAALLRAEGVDVMEADTRGVLARGPKPGAVGLMVLDRPRGLPERVLPLAEATTVFQRYQDEHVIQRLYVPRREVERAQALLAARAPAS